MDLTLPLSQNHSSPSKKDKDKQNKYQKTLDFLFNNLSKAVDFKTKTIVYQGLTVQEQLERADKQYKREYTDEVATMLRQRFYKGKKNPSRYYPLTCTRVDAFRGWKSDLIINNLESSFIVSSTPKPRIKTENEQELRDEIAANFLNMKLEELQAIPQDQQADFLKNLLKSNNIDIEIDTFINKMDDIKEIQISSLSNEKCDKIKKILADYIVEGDFRRQYIAAIHNQILFGIGFMRFPEYRRVKALTEKNKLSYEVKPKFRSVSPFNVFCSADGMNVFDCSFIAEVTQYSKDNFIELIGSKNFIDSEIEKIVGLDDEGNDLWKDQNDKWFTQKYANSIIKLNNVQNDTLDDITYIPVVIIECTAPVSELDSSIVPESLKNKEYVDCEFIITENQIIYAKIEEIMERSYYDIPFIKTDNNVWGSIGIAARLYDTEYRINNLLHSLEMNIAYSIDPINVVNDSLVTSDIQDRPNPGAMLHYSEEARMTSGNQSAFNPVYLSQPQYAQIMNIISDLIRKADDESLIPSYAFSNGYQSSRTSLGEIKLKMDNAFRSVKEIFLQEDVCFLTPCLESMFRRIVSTEAKKLKIDTDYLDLDLKIRGLIGILEEDSYKLKAEEMFQKFAQFFGSGLLDPMVEKYLINNYLSAFNIPLNALGVEDPVLGNAISYSMNLFNQGRYSTMRATSQASMNAQVDGRSGAMPDPGVPSQVQQGNYTL